MSLFKLPERQFRIFVPFLLLSFLYIFAGCTFGSQGMGQGFSQHGIYCIRGAVKFTPTPSAIAGGPSDGPATPVSDKDCKDMADGFGASWKFWKPGDNESLFGWTKWDIYDSVLTVEGNSFCLLKVYIPSNVVFDKGLGEWQAEFSMGDWTATCPAAEITYCADHDHEPQILQVYNTTQHNSGCETSSEGVNDINQVPFPD